MKTSSIAPLAFAFLLGLPLSGHASLSAYSQDFENLLHSGSGNGNSALGDDGWLVYAHVFKTNGSYDYGYGSFPAPNGNIAFSGIDVGQGGLLQGAQQLVVYSDYTNAAAHSGGEGVEAFFVQEQVIGAGDVGTTWTFRFDAGPYAPLALVAPSTAQAFIKTLDPANNYQVTGSSWVDMSSVAAWGPHSLSLTITASAGQLLQFGFSNKATHYDASAVAYDNIVFAPVPESASGALMLSGLGVLGLVARRRQPKAHRVGVVYGRSRI